MKSEAPEIHIDFNARMTDAGYLVVNGTLADLAKLGLTPDQAVGRFFLFNGGDDSNKHGEPAEIMCRGVIAKDPKWGYLAVADANGLFWRARGAQQGIQPDGPASGGSAG